MARSGDTEVEFTPRFFEEVLRQPKVERLTDEIAAAALAKMQADAPRDTEAYVEGLHIEHHDSRYRRTTRVVGSDEKTLLIESKTGTMARGLKAAKR
ncbi:HK97 gp10 family phage protein [Microbacterium algeriense]|uniref:HK97 gp10 family phage protein n=1 Tax=Microbacterium algeriense TaxID=2615184 RepID=A0ABQ6VE63_9MICO|nr:HK97 gp10 family phage protein [Microbacterium algeriense]KAB1867334.1 HK97 gp10 family phage protein [Microbacterium algeriense]